MNENERIKQELDALDVYPRFETYAKTGFESIDPDDFVRMRWYGLYQQKPNVGHFMLRIKVPGGILTTSQLKAVADVTQIYARGITDITTRQNFQFHWLTIHDIPDIFRRFDEVGITAQGACGDIFRNVTGCPIAGIDPDEVFDARPEVDAVHEFFLDNKEFSNLPRKYKTSISGCCSQCAQPEINCIGAIAVTRPRADGTLEEGYQVRVGGGLSARPFLSQKLDMFVPRDKMVEVFRGITVLFRDYGNRENRKKARLKFLVHEWGVERFEEELRKILDFTPDKGVEWPDPRRGFRDHVGVHPQKQPGLSYIGAAVLTGRLSADQVDELARLTEVYGNGELRTTNQQNLIIPGVKNENVDDVVKALADIKLPVEASPFRRVAVACTGNEFCNLAITETKNLLHEIVDHLDQTVAFDEPIRINLNGCPNSCGQHHIGDIGLQGCLVKGSQGTVEGYDISLGGRLGAEARFVRPIWRRVPSTDVKFALENLLNGYLDHRADDDDFPSFVDRHSDEELAALMKTAFAEPAEA